MNNDYSYPFPLSALTKMLSPKTSHIRILPMCFAKNFNEIFVTPDSGAYDPVRMQKDCQNAMGNSTYI